MFASEASAWGQARRQFADQFEQDGDQFIYRKSQKGEGYRITAEDRDRFVAEFDLRTRWSMWLLVVGVMLVLGAVSGLSLYRGTDPSKGALFAGMAVAVLPYLAHFLWAWAWAAPARALANRIPVAPKRSTVEARRIHFGYITYGQLAGAAAAGILIPIVGNPGGDFAGWNGLWLAVGLAIVLLAAVQAFRKWRIERDGPTLPGPAAARNAGVERNQSRFLPYIPVIALLAGLAFLGFTEPGRQLAQVPALWAIVLACLGGWALFTVAQALVRGDIEPFVRGLSHSYERDSQPKRFWASVAWNSLLGATFIWFAFQLNQDDDSQAVVDRCYDPRGRYERSEVVSACDRLFDDSSAALSENPRDGHALYNRGFVHLKRGNLELAVADFSQVIRLHPDAAGAYFYRWSAYQDLGDEDRAEADLAVLERLHPESAAYLRKQGQDPDRNAQ